MKLYALCQNSYTFGQTNAGYHTATSDEMIVAFATLCDNERGLEVCEEKEDNPEPVNYLPIIPMSLVNGISGMAIGFATNILPRNVNDIVLACIEYLNTSNITQNIRIEYPKFDGEIVKLEENKYQTEGIIEKEIKGKKIILFDDVVTTGATLNEARRALKRAGAKDVFCITLAH